MAIRVEAFMLKHIYVFLVFLCVYQAFNLIPSTHIPGVFNITDIGLLLIFIGITVCILRASDLSMLNNVITWHVFAYLIYVLAHVGIAGIYYGYSVVGGLIGVRHQFFWLSFLLFMLAFEKSENFAMFLNIISYVVMVLIILSVVNYVGPTLFYHDWAEGQGIRLGVTRGFIPAMPLVSMAGIWEGAKFVFRDRGKLLNGGRTILILAAHVFRMSRSRYIGVMSILFVQMVAKKQFKLLLVLAFVMCVGIATLDAFLADDLILGLIQNTVEELVEGKGSWASRMPQIEKAFDDFQKYPIFGSGAVAIRITEGLKITSDKQAEQVLLMVANRDLGFLVWLKLYGLVGVVWMTSFFLVLILKALRVAKRGKGNTQIMAVFGLSSLGFILITSINLNHYTLPAGCILVCLTAAAIMRADMEYRRSRATEGSALDAAEKRGITEGRLPE